MYQCSIKYQFKEEVNNILYAVLRKKTVDILVYFIRQKRKKKLYKL